jgi:hypothetical protein
MIHLEIAYPVIALVLDVKIAQHQLFVYLVIQDSYY